MVEPVGRLGKLKQGDVVLVNLVEALDCLPLLVGDVADILGDDEKVASALLVAGASVVTQQRKLHVGRLLVVDVRRGLGNEDVVHGPGDVDSGRTQSTHSGLPQDVCDVAKGISNGVDTNGVDLAVADHAVESGHMRQLQT